MREEIRLGNEALAQNDLETAKRHFQQLLDHGGTHIQEQIVGNRLREIEAKQEALRTPLPAKPPTRRPTPRGKTRVRSRDGEHQLHP
jgi:hypothetical protein